MATGLCAPVSALHLLPCVSGHLCVALFWGPDPQGCTPETKRGNVGRGPGITIHSSLRRREGQTLADSHTAEPQRLGSRVAEWLRTLPAEYSLEEFAWLGFGVLWLSLFFLKQAVTTAVVGAGTRSPPASAPRGPGPEEGAEGSRAVHAGTRPGARGVTARMRPARPRRGPGSQRGEAAPLPSPLPAEALNKGNFIIPGRRRWRRCR